METISLSLKSPSLVVKISKSILLHDLKICEIDLITEVLLVLYIFVDVRVDFVKGLPHLQ